MILDAAVKWDPHVDAMAKKVVQKIGALWRSRRCLSLSSRIQYVKSVIMPDLLYGSNAFSSSLKVSQLDRLQVLQNRAARAVCRLTPRLSLCSNGCPCTEFASVTPRSGSSWCGAVSMGKPAASSRTYSHHQLAAPPGTRFPGASLSPRHSQKPADLAWPFRQPWPGTLSQGV